MRRSVEIADGERLYHQDEVDAWGDEQDARLTYMLFLYRAAGIQD